MSFGDRVLWLLITGFGSGLAPMASGTFGTLPAVAIAWVIQHFWFKDAGVHRNYAMVLLVLALVLFFIGFFTTDFVHRVFQSKDPKPFAYSRALAVLLRDQERYAEAEIEYADHSSPSIHVAMQLTSDPAGLSESLAGRVRPGQRDLGLCQGPRRQGRAPFRHPSVGYRTP